MSKGKKYNSRYTVALEHKFEGHKYFDLTIPNERYYSNISLIDITVGENKKGAEVAMNALIDCSYILCVLCVGLRHQAENTT